MSEVWILQNFPLSLMWPFTFFLNKKHDISFFLIYQEKSQKIPRKKWIKIPNKLQHRINCRVFYNTKKMIINWEYRTHLKHSNLIHCRDVHDYSIGSFHGTMASLLTVYNTKIYLFIALQFGKKIPKSFMSWS